MKIFYCSSEAYPFSKTGGLADVAAALPKTLNAHGHQVHILIPLYKQNLSQLYDFTFIKQHTFMIDDTPYDVEYYQTSFDGTSYILIRNDMFFDRQKLYGYEDDDLRFSFFNYAILEFIRINDQFVDIIHINDWQTSLIPFLIDTTYKKLDPKFDTIKTLLTIHNLEKQGSFSLETEKYLGHKNFTYMHQDQVNFLKTGIMRANAINTVSESYKNEILTRFYGFNLQGPLKSRQYQLFGILNGFDESLYNPLTSSHLYKNYDENSFLNAKKVNKEKLLEKLGFKPDLDKPMIAFINRFARQKGIDILMQIIEKHLKNEECYLIILGQGDALYESYFEELAHKYPHLVYDQNSFDLDLSQKVYAASDLFLLPSLFEPCGLNHMIAMKFGTLPIVRETGGLKDTVTPYNKFTGIGVGFTFKNNDASELSETISTAFDLYHHHKDAFNEMIHLAMHVHHSMDKMASQYESLYLKLIQNEI